MRVARVLPVVLLLAAACTTHQVVRATGESVAALGDTFATTGALMDQALDAHLVTPEQYKKWAAFARRFKLVYLPASDLWVSAAQANDAAAAAHAAEVLAALSAELAQFEPFTKLARSTQ